MYAIRQILALPLKEIGGLFGGRDHSTVLYSIQKVEGRLESDPDFQSEGDGDDESHHRSAEGTPTWTNVENCGKLSAFPRVLLICIFFPLPALSPVFHKPGRVGSKPPKCVVPTRARVLVGS